MNSNLEFGDKNIILKLKPKMTDFNELMKIYSSLINEIISTEYWSRNKNTLRIKWQDGNIARSIRKDIFSCSGIYLWGADKVPRYIGKTVKQNFNKRFNKYIWGEKSQCNLAKNYEKK